MPHLSIKGAFLVLYWPTWGVRHIHALSEQGPLLTRFLPKNLKLIGYARSKLSPEDLHEKIRGYLKGDDKTKDEFLSRVTYVPGSYDGDEGFQVTYASQQRYQGPAVVLGSDCLHEQSVCPSNHACVRSVMYALAELRGVGPECCRVWRRSWKRGKRSLRVLLWEDSSTLHFHHQSTLRCASSSEADPCSASTWPDADLLTVQHYTIRPWPTPDIFIKSKGRW